MKNIIYFTKKGQALVMASIFFPMLIAFMMLGVGTGVDIYQNLNLSATTESAVLSAANQINGQYYYQNATLEIQSITNQPNQSPCSTTTNNNQVLCTIQTVLCDNYNQNATNQATCINSSPTTCNANTAGTNGLVTVMNCDGAPTSNNTNTLNYWATVSSDQQSITLQTWYDYPNPFGDILINSFNMQNTQTASIVLTGIPQS